jgi:hypothetical protein
VSVAAKESIDERGKLRDEQTAGLNAFVMVQVARRPEFMDAPLQGPRSELRHEPRVALIIDKEMWRHKIGTYLPRFHLTHQKPVHVITLV